MIWERYNKALHLAITSHTGQLYGQMPYVHHLLTVERQLFIFSFHPQVPDILRKTSLDVSEDLLLACILHDIIEDTEITKAQVEILFGRRVADLVSAVTNDKEGSRKEQFARTYPRIKSTPNAIIVKLCDRIANLESCLTHRVTKDRERVTKLFLMYQKEYPSFRGNLYSSEEPLLERMWLHLDRLCRIGHTG